MSNETKRDVLEKLIECYAEVSEAYIREIGSPYYCDDEPDYIDEYDTALPDDLPVIPKYLGELIRVKGHLSLGKTLGTYLAPQYSGDEKAEMVNRWLHDKDYKKHQDTFALAWVLGVWRVEETGEIVKLRRRNETRD
jgi:hypothetical protein